MEYPSPLPPLSIFQMSLSNCGASHSVTSALCDVHDFHIHASQLHNLSTVGELALSNKAATNKSGCDSLNGAGRKVRDGLR